MEGLAAEALKHSVEEAVKDMHSADDLVSELADSAVNEKAAG